jgi:hypothetical protein
MNQVSDGQDSDLTRVGTVCLIVGFCVGLGLGVAALATYVDAQEGPRG